MLSQEYHAIKHYLDLYLAKAFIQKNMIFYSVPVLFVKKYDGRIRLCVDYQSLNAIIQNDWYSIYFIGKTLARLENVKKLIKTASLSR